MIKMKSVLRTFEEALLERLDNHPNKDRVFELIMGKLKERMEFNMVRDGWTVTSLFCEVCGVVTEHYTKSSEILLRGSCKECGNHHIEWFGLFSNPR